MMVTFTLIKRASNTLRGFLLISMLLLVATSAWTQCANNNDDPPTLPILCGDDDGDGLDDCIFIIDYENYTDEDFCIDTDGGCAQIMITNIPTIEGGICPPQIAFTLGQGCGGASGNICYWVDTDGDGTVDNIGGGEGEMNICVVGSTMTIYACRPGNGPISIGDIRFEPEFNFPESPAICIDDVAEAFALPELPINYAGGDWVDAEGNAIANSSAVTIAGEVGDCFTFTYSVSLNFECATDACTETESVTYCIETCSSCDFTPEIICPEDFVGCSTADITPGQMGFPHDFPSFPNVKDIMVCGPLVFDFSDAIVSNGITCNEATVIERTWFAHYEFNVEDTIKCIQMISLVDNEAPVFETCPDNITVSEGGTINWVVPTVTDNCGFMVSSSHTSESVFPIGCTTVTYTATDDCFNSSTCTFEVCVNGVCTDLVDLTCPDDFIGCIGDEILPTITGSPLTGSGTSISCGDIVLNFDDDIITQNDPCDGAIVLDRIWSASFTNNPEGVKNCSQLITITDTEAPNLSTCPANINLVAGQNTATWIAPTATDNCGHTMTSNYNSGDAFPVGCTIVTYSAADNCGNEVSCSFEVCVESACAAANAVPIITCPADYSSCPGSSIDPTVTGNPTVTSTSIECGSIVTFYDSVAETYAGCAGGQRIERLWVAKYADNPADSAVCIQIIDLIDNINPTIVCPNNITLPSTNNTAVWETPTFEDACGATIGGNYTSGTAFPVGCTPVTYIATDNCGNSASCTFNVCVEEAPCSSIPIITCPADFVGCPGSSIDPADTGNPTVTTTSTECGTIVTFFDNVVEEYANCPGGRRIERTWSAEYSDNPGNPATCIQIIDLKDTEVPVVSCPNDISLTGGNKTATWTTPTFTDNCGASLSGSHSSGATFEEGCTTVTYTATDNCGNTATCSFQVCVEAIDECTTPLIIKCPEDYIGCPGDPISPNDVGIPITENPIAGCGDIRGYFEDKIIEEYDGCANSVRIERTWEVAYVGYREFSVFCTQIIDLKDDTDPVIQCPESINLTGGDLVATWSEPTVIDNCGATLESTHVSGSTFEAGCTTITYTATDNCGNATSCSFAVCVEQAGCTGVPTILCPPSYFGCPNSSIDPAVCGIPTVVSSNPNCGTILGYVDSEASLYPNCPGGFRIERLWTVYYEDNPGEVTTCLQIIDLNDTEVPEITSCPTNITLTGGDNIATWTPASYSDNCGATLSGTHTSGSSFPVGCTPVTYTVTDNCGNAVSCSFNVCVEAACNSVPNLSCPPSYFGCPGSSIHPDVCGRPTVSNVDENCGRVLGYYDVTLEEYANCPGGIRIERTWEVFYENNPNEKVTCTQIIDLNDSQVPTISCPDNISITGGATSVTWDPATFTDNCGASLSSTHVSGSSFSVGCTTVTYTVEDNCGNSAACNFDVCIANTCSGVPTINCPADYVGCPGSSISSSVTGNASATSSNNSCGQIIITHIDETVETYNCQGARKIKRTWKAYYLNNPSESVECEQFITLNDTTTPSISGCPGNINGFLGETINWAEPTFNDDCSYTVSQSHFSGTVFPEGCTTVTYTVTDGCGNAVSCDFTVCIENECNAVPDISCPPDFIGCPGSSIDPSITGNLNILSSNNTCGSIIICHEDEVIRNFACDGSMEIRREWKAVYSENEDNPVYCYQIIKLEDRQNPSITNCPADITADEGTVINWTTPTFTDNCTYTVSSSHSSGTTFPLGCTTVTYTVTDGCGATATCSFNVCINAVCDEVPVLNCPADYSGCPGTSTDPSITGQATATATTNDCGQIVISHTDEIITAYNCTNANKIRRTWKAYYQDNASQVTTCVQIIDMNDNQAPTITNCPVDISANEGETIHWAAPDFADNCSYAVSSTHNTGSTFPVGCTTVTYTVTDGCGATATCSFDVCITAVCDDTPSITCPADYVGCPGTSTNSSVTGLPSVSSSSNDCGQVITEFTDEVLETYSCNGGQRIRRTWKTYHADNSSSFASCTQIIDLRDTQAPTITNCPSNISVDEGQVVTWNTPTFNDNCSFNVNVTHTSGTTFPVGCTTVTYTVTDPCGNTTGCSFEVCVNKSCDAVPSISCPSVFRGCAVDTDDPAITGYPTTSGSVAGCGEIVVNYSDMFTEDYTDECAGSKKVVRMWYASYANNPIGSSSCIQVIDLHDKQRPTVHNCPPNLTMTGGAQAVTWEAPRTTDNCGSNDLILTTTHTSGTVFTEGCTTVIYTATDACGNNRDCSFEVCIEGIECDETPTLTCLPDYSSCPGSSIDPATTGTPTVSGGATACGDVDLSYTDQVVQTYAGCNNARRILRTWRAQYVNNDGHFVMCIQEIDLRDQIDPVLINCPTNINLTGGNKVATWTAPTATDNCSSVNISSTHSSGSTFNDGCTTVSYTATDDCGNSTNCSFTVCVENECNSVPIITCPADYVGCPGGSIDPSVTGNPTVTTTNTQCGSIVTYYDEILEEYANCNGGRKIKRTWSASYSENSNNAATCEQIIDLRDTQNPTVSCPNNINLTGGSKVATWSTPSVTDNCGATLSGTHASGATFEDGCTTVTYTATDNCGNVSTCNFTVCVENECNSVPIITCPADYVGCPGGSIDPSVTGNPTVTTTNTQCGSIVTYYDEILEEYANCNGGRKIKRTWSASYSENSDNAATCIQIIDLKDTQNPSISCPSNINLTGGNKVATWTTPSVTDNCGATLSSTHSSGSTFADGCSTVTYTATDGCSNTRTCSFTVCVENECNSVPIITCPADYVGCPGGSIDPSVTGNPTVTTTNTECGSIVTYYDEILEEYANCNGGRKIKRTWSASYSENSDNAATCIQIIDLKDTQNPSISCPSNINLTGGNKVATWTTPSVTDNCGATLSSTHSSGSTFADGCTTVTYTATDGCSNTRTCSFTVCVEDECNSVPIITCPADYVGCPGGSIDPSVTGNPTVTTTNTECGSIVTYYDEILEEYANCNGGRKIKRTWSASYSENSDNAATCIQIIDLRDTQNPSINCPANITLTGGDNVASWSTPSVTDNCGATLSTTHSSGSMFEIGCTTVTYTATDNCANTRNCSFQVCVEDGGLGNVGIECVEDMVIACGENGGATAHWDIPTVEASCNACTGNQIAGFIYMGTHNGHQYYCSNDPALWTTAQANCVTKGGYLAVINTAAENAFLANLLTIQSAYIGCSDEASEGNFKWVNGDALNYTNWYPGQPNNYNNAQHHVELLSNGQWNDQYVHVPLEYIMEIPCASMTQTGGPAYGSQLSAGCYDIEYTYNDACNNFAQCTFEVCVEAALTLNCVKDVTVSCPNTDGGIIVNWEEPQVTTCCTNCGPNGSLQIDGFLYMGSFGGSNYYCSNDPALWPNAKKTCEGYGGNLAVITSAEENEFLANILTIQSAYIGLSDANSQGNYTWCDGSALEYTNWYPGQPNNYNNKQDYCEMLSNGQWNDQYNTKALEFIMEIPSCIDVSKIQGPANGSYFPVGTTSITYEATDACGYKDDCTFNITVAKSGCVSGGQQSSFAWINKVEFANINNTSGNNGGYNDFTNVCGDISAGYTYPLKLTPGFPSSASTVYWKCYIDFNNDGDYTDSGEYIATGSGIQTLSGNITIPTNIWNGRTTMRVVMRKGGPPSGPCDVFTYGETEDYCIKITGADFDSGEEVAVGRSRDNHDNVVRLIAEDFITVDLHQGSAQEEIAENEAISEEVEEVIRESTNELSNRFSINVFPNPASEKVNIHNLTSNKIKSIEIVNVSGQVVYTETGENFESRDKSINISNLPSGIYMIKVIDETGQRVSKKLSVQKF